VGYLVPPKGLLRVRESGIFPLEKLKVGWKVKWQCSRK
jgi:hypothetical protein